MPLLDGNFGYTRQKLGAEGPDLGTNFGLDVLRIPGTNSGRNPIRGPGFWNVDFGCSRP